MRCPVDWRGEEGDCLEISSVPPSPPPRSMAVPCQSTEGYWGRREGEKCLQNERREVNENCIHERKSKLCGSGLDYVVIFVCGVSV